jgi:hypothetical protein
VNAVHTIRLAAGRVVQAVVLFFAVLIWGCGAATPAAVSPSRAVCYAAADMRAQERADTECRLGDTFVPFAECPSYPDIMSELQRSQEACK